MHGVLTEITEITEVIYAILFIFLFSILLAHNLINTNFLNILIFLLLC